MSKPITTRQTTFDTWRQNTNIIADAVGDIELKVETTSANTAETANLADHASEMIAGLSVTSGQATVDIGASAFKVRPGMLASSSSLPTNTSVEDVDYLTGVVTMSENFTTTGTTSITFTVTTVSALNDLMLRKINKHGDTIVGDFGVTGTSTLNILQVDGNTTLGNAGGDTVTVNASTVDVPNGLNIDSNTLVIDATNNRVGVGVAAPTNTLEVLGSIRAKGTSGVLVSSAGVGSSEGGQVVLGYKNVDVSAQANSTWNLDVDTNNAFRILKQNAAGATSTPISVAESDNAVTISSSTANTLGNGATGALVVTGGVGVGGNLTIEGDVQIDGGDLQGGATTMNVMTNATVTTVNVGGAAAVNLATSAAAARTVTVGGAITGNTLKIAGTTSGTVNYTSDVTTGAVNFNTGLSTGTLNIGSAAAGKVLVAFNTATTNTTTGALVVTGGVGVGGGIQVGGNVVLTGTDANLATGSNFISNDGTDAGLSFDASNNATLSADLTIQGGDLITNQTSFRIIDATATTVDFAGAATTLNIGHDGTSASTTGVATGALASGTKTLNLATGASAGTTNVNIGASNAGTTTISSPTTTLSGDLGVNGGDITTNQTTFNLIDTTATTLNVGGAATTLTIGHDGTSASTTNVATGALASGTKTLNIGTGASAGTTNLNFGAATGTATFNGALSVTGIGTFANDVNMNANVNLGNANTDLITVAGDLRLTGKLTTGASNTTNAFLMTDGGGLSVPVLRTFTSTDGSISFTYNAGTVNIESSGTIPGNITLQEDVTLGTAEDDRVIFNGYIDGPAKYGTTAAGGVIADVVPMFFSGTGATSAGATGTVGTLTYDGTGTYRSAEFQIQCSNSTTNYFATKIMAVFDGTNTLVTEYGTIRAGFSTLDFSVEITGGSLVVSYTGAPGTNVTTTKIIATAFRA